MEEKRRHPQFSTKGLVAHYKLWAGLTATAKVHDYAGGFTGDPTGTDIAPAYPGFKFNGTDDNIFINSGPSSVKTVAAWFKNTSVGVGNFEDITGLNFTDMLYTEVDTLKVDGFAGGVLYVDGEQATTVSTDWHLGGVTVTAGKDASGGAFLIGNSNIFASFYEGLIGEVFLFSDTKTPAEMKSLYELTKWRYPNN